MTTSNFICKHGGWVK